MSRGRRRDTPHTKGVRSQKLTDDAKLARTAAGQAYPKAAPSAEALREFIAAQTCPWCGKGPWQVLARHTHSAHGVSASEIRELAGLTKYTPVCSKDHSSGRRERLLGRPLPDSAHENLRQRREEGVPAEMSEAGKEANRRKLEAARAKLAANAKLTDEVVLEARQRCAQGELIKDLAAEFGVHERTMGLVVKGRIWSHVGGPIKKSRQARTGDPR